jgi:hypothetical protein
MNVWKASMKRNICTITIILLLIFLAGSCDLRGSGITPTSLPVETTGGATHPGTPAQGAADGASVDAKANAEAGTQYRAKGQGLAEGDKAGIVRLCDDALTAYYKASESGVPFQGERYFGDGKLCEYTQKKIDTTARQRKEFSSLNAAGVGIEVTDLTIDEQAGLCRLTALCDIRLDYGGEYREGVDLLVQNRGGRLVIVDWYQTAKDSYDEITRGRSTQLGDPEVWNDVAWADTIIRKLNILR